MDVRLDGNGWMDELIGGYGAMGNIGEGKLSQHFLKKTSNTPYVLLVRYDE